MCVSLKLHNGYESISISYFFIVFVIFLLLLLFITIPLSFGCCDEENSTFAVQIQEILILINRDPDHF